MVESHEVEDKEFNIIIPKYSNAGKKIKTEEIKSVAKKMSGKFGGVTVYPSVLGCWKSDKTGRLECEENIIISSISDDGSYGDEEKFIDEIVKEIGKEFGQESVMSFSDRLDVDFTAGKRKQDLPSKTGIDFFSKRV